MYVPLSYGDERHRDMVVEHGETVLGDKFVPMLEFMEKPDYSAFLQTITVGVFNFDRQQGLGNVTLLMQYGAKVYVSIDNPIREDFLREGCVLFDVERITEMSFEEFIEYRQSDLQRNARHFDPLVRHEENVKKWLTIYDFFL